MIGPGGNLGAKIDDVGDKVDVVEQEVYEVEKHLHNFEKWFGVAAAPSGETHVADRLGGTILPFALVSGASDFGSWVQVLGSSDTPVRSGMTKFDLHRCIITDTDSTALFNIQIITGESAGFAAKLLAEDFDEFPYISASNNNDSGISDVIDSRCVVGEKVWMRTACVGQSGKTISLYPGIHEYLR